MSEEGVDVSQVPATGPGGRVTKGDVLAHLQSPGEQVASSSTAPVAAEAATGHLRTGGRVCPCPRNSPAHERAPPAHRPAPGAGPADRRDPDHVQRSGHVQSDRPSHPLQGVVPEEARRGARLHVVLHQSVDRCAQGLSRVNARIEGNEIVYHNFFDVGVAVSTDRGLMVPVIRAADQRSFASIEQAIVQYATKAREGTISVDDLQGGTFTITNGGTFGSLLSTPILNPPQSAILGMHAMKKRPVVVDDQIVIRSMMYLALSYDHRLIDGRAAVSFLVRVKDCIENPERMMFEL